MSVDFWFGLASGVALGAVLVVAVASLIHNARSDHDA